MSVKIITAPEFYPVTVAESKSHMNIAAEFIADDTLIGGLIASATDQAENMTRRQLVEATLELVLDEFPSGAIELPRPPLVSVASITYIDTDGVEQTMASGAYAVDTDSLVGRVYPVYGTEWPSTLDIPGVVAVRYVAGWSMDDETSPPEWTGPEAIKTWIKVKVASLYEQREAHVIGQTIADMSRNFVDCLLDPYVIPMVV